jgi:predicted nucleotidyltransferase
MIKLTDYISKEKLEAFCRKNHIIKMSLFGSVLRDELNPESDIDILVEFDKGHMPGLMDLAGMEIELGEMVGRKVDLRTPAELSRYFRDDVLEEARVEYAIQR